MKSFAAALARHTRFYIALLCGLAAWFAARHAGLEMAPLAGGDVFYVVFLALCAPLFVQKPADLKRHAKTEDEGIAIVVLVTVATLAFFCAAIFAVLNSKQGMDRPTLVAASLGAPLGWFTLHTIMAFHYADIHYFEDGDGGDLDFPGKGQPGVWDFLYFSFVIGMTAQVSDVQVKTCVMRRAVLLHAIVSFFFNTVFIAMAVNAGVAMAS